MSLSVRLRACVRARRNFWEVVLSFPVDLQKKLLHFATGSDRIPVGGMAELNFKISKIDAPTDWYEQKRRVMNTQNPNGANVLVVLVTDVTCSQTAPSAKSTVQRKSDFAMTLFRREINICFS